MKALKYAVIDIGSNTIKMQIYEVRGKAFRKVRYESIPAGLINYIDDGIMNARGTDVLCSALTKFISDAGAAGVKNVHSFATASLRRADNREDILRTVKEKTGAVIHIMSGDEEAECSFSGIITETCGIHNAVLLDMGGGSTEITAFDGVEPAGKASLPFGSLSLYRDFVSHTLPSEGEKDAIKRYVKDEITSCGISGKNLFVSGGTGRAVCTLCSHPSELYTAEISALYVIAHEYSHKEDTLKKILPERYKTVLPGLYAMLAAAEFFGSDKITFPRAGVREGYLLSII